jgi:hypothetical protein
MKRRASVRPNKNVLTRKRVQAWSRISRSQSNERERERERERDSELRRRASKDNENSEIKEEPKQVQIAAFLMLGFWQRIERKEGETCDETSLKCLFWRNSSSDCVRVHNKRDCRKTGKRRRQKNTL